MKPADRFPELTEGQKTCLRLVDDLHTSKEIARILGISPFTVDQRLDSARRKLNAESRREAAKIFAAFDENLYQPLVYDPLQLESATIAGSLTGRINRTGSIFSRMFEMTSFPPIGGERHELSGTEVIKQSLSIAFFSALVVATIVIVLMGTMRLFA